MPELDGPPKTAVKDWHAGTLQDAAEGFMVTAEEPHVPLQAPLTIPAATGSNLRGLSESRLGAHSEVIHSQTADARRGAA